MTHPPGSDLLDALLASVADAIYLVDADGRVRFANPAALASSATTRRPSCSVAPSHATIHHTSIPTARPTPRQECPLLRPRATGEVVRVDDDWFVRRDGRHGAGRVLLGAGRDADGGRGAVVVFRDISERAAPRPALPPQLTRRAPDRPPPTTSAAGSAATSTTARSTARQVAAWRCSSARASVSAEARELLDQALAEPRARSTTCATSPPGSTPRS